MEIESGKRNDRPKLAEALASAACTARPSIIAKLDRLARNVAFISNLMESGVEFTAVDFPQANRLTVHILAAVAEHEREMISQRTKAALAAAKARGTKLGDPATSGTAPAAPPRSAHVRRERASKRTADLKPMVAMIRAAGATSLRAVAAELNRRGVPAAGGGTWHANSVRRLLAAT